MFGVIFASALAAAGCGGDGADDAYDYEGFWLMTSWTIDEGSGPATIVRDGTPNGLLGDIVFDASSATGGMQSVRFAATEDGVILDLPMQLDQGVVVESDRWVISIENDPGDPTDDAVVVYTTSRSGDDLTLSSDPDDPRNDGGDGGPTEIVLTRTAAWETTLVGSWVLSEMDGADPAACTTNDGMEWGTMQVLMEVDERWMMNQTMHEERFDNDTCSGSPTSTNDQEMIIYAEHEGAEFRMHMMEASGMDDGGYIEWQVSTSGSSHTLDRTGCLPASFCSQVPMQVVLAPAP